MSEQVEQVEQIEVPVQPTKTVSDIQCGMCGRDGGTYAECELCRGNVRLNQTRTFTLSEERQGLNQEANKERYGRTGDVSPKIVVLPGGYDPRQGKG